MEWLKLFLGIGEKVKACRARYELKQASFSKFGVSQHYLSMIERQKRQPTIEMIDQIYDAFYLLTNGEIEELYSKKSFRYTKEEQAEAYLLKRCQTEDILTHYEESLAIAQTFQLDDMLHRLNVEMGDYYQSILQYDLSTNFFMKAIHDNQSKSRNLSYCYHQLGDNMKFTDNYKVALIYYTLAAQYTRNKTSIVYYQLKYNIVVMNIKLHQYEVGLNEIELLLNEVEDLALLTKTWMLKHYTYIQMGRYLEAQHLMIKFLEQEKFEPYQSIAYYNLSYSLMLNQQHEEALQKVEQAIKLSCDSFRTQVSYFMKSRIYYELEKNVEAKHYLMQSKKEILGSTAHYYIKDWYEVAVKVAFSTQNFEEIYTLLNEIRALVNQGRLNESFINELKINILTWCCSLENGDIDHARTVCLMLLTI